MMRRVEFHMAGAALAAALFLGQASTGARAAPPRVTIEECAFCHGIDGIAKERDVPHLAGQNEGYLYNQLMAFRSGKRAHKEMRYESRQLTVQEIEALAAYYASLPPR
jgi:cytochrome c553